MANTRKFPARVHGGPLKATRPVEKLPTSPGAAHKKAKTTLVDTPHPNATPNAHVKTSPTSAMKTKVGGSAASGAIGAGNPNAQPVLPYNDGKKRSAM